MIKSSQQLDLYMQLISLCTVSYGFQLVIQYMLLLLRQSSPYWNHTQLGVCESAANELVV